MAIFQRPTNLNGAELKQEFAAAGVSITQLNDLLDGTIRVETDNEVEAAKIVAAHNGTTVAPEPTIADKLASVGLSLDELKSAILGGN
jgi:hypothetical protein